MRSRSSADRHERGGQRSRAQTGSVTAEFATVVPAVMLVLVCCMGAMQLVGQQVRLTDAAADGSRSLARGDGLPAASDRVHRLVGRVVVATETKGQFVCMTLSSASTFAPARALGVTVAATGCALAGGL